MTSIICLLLKLGTFFLLPDSKCGGWVNLMRGWGGWRIFAVILFFFRAPQAANASRGGSAIILCQVPGLEYQRSFGSPYCIPWAPGSPCTSAPQEEPLSVAWHLPQCRLLLLHSLWVLLGICHPCPPAALDRPSVSGPQGQDFIHSSGPPLCGSKILPCVHGWQR